MANPGRPRCAAAISLKRAGESFVSVAISVTVPSRFRVLFLPLLYRRLEIRRRRLPSARGIPGRAVHDRAAGFKPGPALFPAVVDLREQVEALPAGRRERFVLLRHDTDQRAVWMVNSSKRQATFPRSSSRYGSVFNRSMRPHATQHRVP